MILAQNIEDANRHLLARGIPENAVARQHLCWSIFDQAIAYVEHGLSLVPLRLDGSKEPRAKWKWRQQRIPQWHDLKADFNCEPAGIGILCGRVSGGLEVLDFDAGELYFPWREMVLPVVGKLPVVKTPKGFHVYYRCKVIAGNKKIAYLAGRDEAAIETRGEGGFVVAPGSPLSVHLSGKSYEQFSGPTLPQAHPDMGCRPKTGVGIPVITPEERKELWSAARSFDQVGQRQRENDVKCRQRLYADRPPNWDGIDLSTPWDAFDHNGPAWREILQPSGWTSVDGIHWRRPGKHGKGHSANVTISRTGCELLVVWSSNAGPLSPFGDNHRTWSKFGAYTAILHDGDRRAAARELSKQGWGRVAQ